MLRPLLLPLLIPIALAGVIACQPRDPKPADKPADPPTPMSPGTQAAPSASRVRSSEGGRQAQQTDDQGAAAIRTAGLSC